MLQLGYGLLKIVLLNLLPELRPLFRSIERGPVEASAAPKPGGAISNKPKEACVSISGPTPWYQL